MKVTHQITDSHYLLTHEVGPRQTGVRLDHFLMERYPRRSRAQLKKAIDEGAISLRRHSAPFFQVGKIKPSLQLIGGDEILVLTERKIEPDVCFDYQILFEDEKLFVINKPPNLPVHPAGRYFFNTLLVHLKTQGLKNPLKADIEYYLVHRIDKETSGALILTKDKDFCTDITRQFAERTTKKKYFAIVRGICPESFEMNLAMKRDPNSKISLKMAPYPESEGGLPAFTGFKRIETFGDFSFIECYPKTGRQHQIRVHLEAAGYPIVGDKLYGLPESEALLFYDRNEETKEALKKLLLPRHALHAGWVSFTHPDTGKTLEFHAPIPQDLKDFLESQKK